MPAKNIREAKNLVKKWMADREILEDEKQESDSWFHIHGVWEDDINFCVVQPKKMPRIVGILHHYIIDPCHIEALESLGQHDRDEFILDVRKGLIYMPIYVIITPPDSPKMIMLIKELSFDELTEGRLAEAIDLIDRAAFVISTAFFENFGAPEEDSREAQIHDASVQ